MPNYSQWAITLPNQFAPAGQILEQGSVLQGRQNQQMMELYRQRLKGQRDDMNANMTSLNKATGDIEKDKTGIEGIDATTHNRVNEVYQKYSKLARQLSPDQYQAALANDLLEVSKWHQGAVMDYGNMLKERDEIMKQHPELDATKVFHTGMDNLAQRYVKPDGTYVPSDQINSTQSLFQNLQNPDELAAHTATTEGIGKFFKSLPSKDYDIKDEVNKKGFIDKAGYKYTSLGDLQERHYDNEGNVVNNPLKFEQSNLTGADGKPLKMIPKSLEQTMRGEGIGNQMDKLWNDNKYDYMHDWAFRNKRLPTPQEEQQLKNAFLYDQFSHHINSDISRNDLQVTPKPAHLSVNINGAGAAGNVNNVYKSIHDKVGGFSDKGFVTRFNSLDEQEQKVVKEAVKDNPNLEPDDDLILAKKPNGETGVYKAKWIKNAKGQGFQLDETTELTTLSPVGTNLNAKQADVNAKRNIVANGNETQTHTTQPTHTSAKKKIAGF